MNSLVTYLFNDKKQSREITWFRNALYLFLLYKVLIYCLQFDILFSNGSLIYHRKLFTGLVSDLAYVLINYYNSYAGIGIIALIGIIVVAGLLKKTGYLANILLWIAMINVSNFLYPTLTAGDYLLHQLLFFNIFFNPKPSANTWINDVKISFHNAALAGIKLQICIAYFFAAWFKLTDQSWLDGSAVYYTFQIPQYSNDLLSIIPLSLCKVLTYITLSYQLLFPFLIWIRPIKIYLLTFGIIQHLIIAFGMGLFTFGIIMIICYILFLKYDNK